MYVKKLRLLTPGPTPLYPPAVRAMAGADIHHRTEDFRLLSKQLAVDLKYFMGTTNDVAIFTSSGTGAMEAAVSNLFSKGDKVIVATAGKFGERWVQLTKAYALDVTVIEEPYGGVVEPQRVADALKKQPDAQGVFVQATETSTGVSHDVKAMAEAVRKSDAIFVVDGITGLGTSELDIDGWGLDVVIGGSQKAVMIPPGLAFASVSQKAWKRREKAKQPYYYFDLYKHAQASEKGESPFTPATSLLLGLAEALRYVREIGRENLIENAQLLARATREAAVAIGLELYARRNPSGAVTAIRPPKGMDSSLIVKAFRERFGAIIANGQGSMKGELFRIAHLGYFDFADLFAVIAELEVILHSLGQPVEFGSGVRAVQQVYAEAAKLTPVAVG
jgi:aspartate aminotransferase-like enzyme